MQKYNFSMKWQKKFGYVGKNGGLYTFTERGEPASGR